jgi:hypothetical protein
MNPVAYIPVLKEGALRSAPWLKRSLELAGMEMSTELIWLQTAPVVGNVKC